MDYGVLPAFGPWDICLSAFDWVRRYGLWIMEVWIMAHGQPQRPPLWLSGKGGDFSTTEKCARALKDIKVLFVPLNGIQSDDPLHLL